MKKFGEYLKELRKGRKMVLEDVAKYCKTHKGYISGIENGKLRPPSHKFLSKFAKLFRVSEKELTRLAFVEKVPHLIRKEVKQLMEERALSTTPSNVKYYRPILLNSEDTNYPTELTPDGSPEPTVNGYLQLVKVPADFAVVTRGDSMETDEGIVSFTEGEPVALSAKDKVKNGDFAFVIYTQGGQKKSAIRQVLYHNGNVTLHPLNEKYEDEHVGQDDIDAMLKVLAKCQLVEPPGVNANG